MITLVILALMTGVALGVILMGMMTAGRREDECRDCRRTRRDGDRMAETEVGERGVNRLPRGHSYMRGGGE